MPKSLPKEIKSNGLLDATLIPGATSILLDDALTFEETGRAFVNDELISWDGVTITATPKGTLQNVQRGLRNTTAVTHVAADSVYNSWITERIEDMTGHVDDQLPNYDPFPDIRSIQDPPPSTIEGVTMDLTISEAFLKLGVRRSDNQIQDGFRLRAEERLAGLRADTLAIEPRVFTDTLVFGGEDILLEQEAPLAKRNIDPWTASLTNVAIKHIPLNPDEMPNPQLPRRLKSEEFTTSIGGFIYFSELSDRWVFRAIKTVANNTTIVYKYSEHRMNLLINRKTHQRGWLDVKRG